MGGLAFVAAISGPIPAITIPFLEGASTELIVSVGLLLGVMAMAASPPVTLAVVSETKSKGRFTDTLITTVIINNIQVVVLFAVALAVAQTLTNTEGAVGAGVVLAQLGWSLGLGSVVGWLASVAIRFIRRDSLLALVGLCFVGAWLAEQLHASTLLTFLTAGVFLNTLTEQGRLFRKVAATLSGPVYVLFFTLIGADLHIDALLEMAPFAVALVLLRLAAYATSVKVAHQIVDLPDPVRRYGFLGLAPQAGIALTVAIGVGHAFPTWGPAFETLGLAAIALNEMVGPILLKFSLGLAGETSSHRDALKIAAKKHTPTNLFEFDDETEEVPHSRLLEWAPETRTSSTQRFDPWGGQPATGDKRLNRACREVSGELQALVRDLRNGPISTRRESGQAFVQYLRREFLRTHRRTTALAGEDGVSQREYLRQLRKQRADLATRWKAILLDRAASADFRSDQSALENLISAVDKSAESLSTAVMSTIDSEMLEKSSSDSFLVAAKKAGLRLKRLFTGKNPVRVVELRALGRFHLSGHVPNYLGDVAGLLTLAERHLLQRARNLFETYDSTMDHLISASIKEKSTDIVARVEQLDQMRTEMEEELQLASREVDQLSDETVRVTAGALGRAYRLFARDLKIAGSPSLPARAFRFSRVYESRQSATQELVAGFIAATDTVKGSAGSLAMELELVRLASTLQENVTDAAEEAGRDVRGKIHLQLGRIHESLESTSTQIQDLLDEITLSAEQVLLHSDKATDELLHIVDTALHTAVQFHTSLRAMSPFTPLMSTVMSAIDQLTDHFVVIYDKTDAFGRGLPSQPKLVEVPFRRMVRAYLETESAKALASLAQDLEEQVHKSFRAIQEVDRVLVFNTDLAKAELEVLGSKKLSETSEHVLQETLVSIMRRMANRVEELQIESSQLAVNTENSVDDAVMGTLHRLQSTILAGRLVELEARLAKHKLTPSREEFKGLAKQATNLFHQISNGAKSTFGEDNIADFRRFLGIPSPEEVIELGPDSFSPTTPKVELPISYRRLFADQALDAGDLLTGKEHRVVKIRSLLIGETEGASRAAAVISIGGMGKDAVVQNLARGLGPKSTVKHLTFTKSMNDPKQTLRMMRELYSAGHGRTVVVVDGFKWLFSIRPGGFEALRAFVSEVVKTSDRVGWLVSADRPVWTYADRLVPLHDAFPEVLNLDAFSPQQLKDTILSRHSMSGFKLQFRRDSVGITTVTPWTRLGQSGQSIKVEDRYFEALHRDSGGLLADALRLWIASIASVNNNNDTVVIGPIPHPPIVSLRRLPEETLITLRQVARQGRITPHDHSAQFRWEPEVSLAFLTRLSHWGLLFKHSGDSFRFDRSLAGPIYRVLRERRLVG